MRNPEGILFPKTKLSCGQLLICLLPIPNFYFTAPKPIFFLYSLSPNSLSPLFDFQQQGKREPLMGASGKAPKKLLNFSSNLTCQQVHTDRIRREWPNTEWTTYGRWTMAQPKSIHLLEKPKRRAMRTRDAYQRKHSEKCVRS